MNVNQTTNCFFSKGLLRIAACTLLSTGIGISQVWATPGGSAESIVNAVQQDACHN